MGTKADVDIQRRAILIVLRNSSTADQWLTSADIAAELGLPDTLVRRRLKSLSKAGKIYHSTHRKRSKTGRWVKYFRWQLMPEVRRNLEQGML